MAKESIGDVRLRRPERAQVVWKAGCCDELIPQGHQARVLREVVQKFACPELVEGDVSPFCEPIKARDGVCGRDCTDPRLLISLRLYAATRGAEVGPAVRREQAVPVVDFDELPGMSLSNAVESPWADCRS